MKRPYSDLQEDANKALKQEESDRESNAEENLSPENAGEIEMLKVGNLGKYVTSNAIKKWLKGQDIKFKNIKCAPKWDYCIVKFESESDKNKCFEQLKDKIYKKNVVELEWMKPRVIIHKKPTDIVPDGRTPEERIADQVTPLWRKSYEEQIAEKEKTMRKSLIQLKEKLFAFLPKNKTIKDIEFENNFEFIQKLEPEDRTLVQLDWLFEAKRANNGMPCPMGNIVASPEVFGYRNKCEFTFGVDLEGKRTVGFLLGTFKDGITTVINPSSCLHVSKAAKSIANILQDIAIQSSFDVYNKVSKKGFWRSALVRTMSTGECMALIQINPADIEQEILQAERQRLEKLLVERSKTEELALKSIYIQEYSGDFNGIVTDKGNTTKIFGEESINESLLGINYCISPTSFFQVNTKATEALYSKIVEVSKYDDGNVDLAENIVLLDLCCGTGTIGISLAKLVKKVIGVEMIAAAVEDARKNAEANGIDNIVFYAEKVEDVIHSVIKNHISEGDKVVAILDPPRNGVHSSVIQNLRTCNLIEKVVFVACDVKQSMNNLVDIGLLAYMGYDVAIRYNTAQANKPKLAPTLDIPPEGCPIRDSSLARLEPPTGQMYLGFHLNWRLQTPLQLKDKLGLSPAIVNAFLQLDTSANPPINWDMLLWHGQEARRISAMLQITIEPVTTPTVIDKIPDDILRRIAETCRLINTEYGTPVFIRFGHEMNGDWTNYGYKPIEYKAGFQKMARAVRAATNMTAMVWGPNLGVNYPFSGGLSALPARGTPNFAELDTNNDTVIDGRDDPYLPYYPGDEYVDWVALSLYWYPDTNTGFNNLPDPSYFFDMIQSRGPAVQREQPSADGQANKNFYQNFAVARNKPIFLAETSAPWVLGITPDARNGLATEAAIKQNWWRQIFNQNVRRSLPKFKGAIWFEETKSDNGLQVRNWEITNDTATLAAFRTDFRELEKEKFVILAPDLKVSCNGEIKSFLSA